MIPIFVGFDPRVEAGTHTFVSSLLEHATVPISIIPLHMPLFRSFYKAGNRDGTNAFTYTKFLIPFLEGWSGSAIYMDGADMLLKADIGELWAMRDPYKPVQVVKHEYKTKFPRKYLGTKMESPNEDYPRKQWSSMMILNCMHFSWRRITPESVQDMTGSDLQRLNWLADDQIGELPIEWNWLVQEHGPNRDAKLLHYSSGIPAFEKHANCAHSADYMRQLERVTYLTD